MLGMHQDIQEKVYDEIMRVFGDSDRDATMEDLNRLVYMEQVIKETLRRWPLIAILMRSATEDLQLIAGKYKIPAGSTIIVPPSIVHLRRDIYPDPYKFDPDRFAPENMAKRHKYTFMAFGGGPRSCIGQ
ncbi:hypothetical protein AAG570_005478 [Ranatra chinensis]|uniref:Cytochrome P450 n=1 Tax=Ranatra chinensis TaxID=642074 RepID=A0ABD0YAF0_9HEMI